MYLYAHRSLPDKYSEVQGGHVGRRIGGGKRGGRKSPTTKTGLSTAGVQELDMWPVGALGLAASCAVRPGPLLLAPPGASGLGLYKLALGRPRGAGS